MISNRQSENDCSKHLELQKCKHQPKIHGTGAQGTPTTNIAVAAAVETEIVIGTGVETEIESMPRTVTVLGIGPVTVLGAGPVTALGAGPVTVLGTEPGITAAAAVKSDADADAVAVVVIAKAHNPAARVKPVTHAKDINN